MGLVEVVEGHPFYNKELRRDGSLAETGIDGRLAQHGYCRFGIEPNGISPQDYEQKVIEIASRVGDRLRQTRKHEKSALTSLLRAVNRREPLDVHGNWYIFKWDPHSDADFMYTLKEKEDTDPDPLHVMSVPSDAQPWMFGTIRNADAMVTALMQYALSTDHHDRAHIIDSAGKPSRFGVYINFDYNKVAYGLGRSWRGGQGSIAELSGIADLERRGIEDRAGTKRMNAVTLSRLMIDAPMVVIPERSLNVYLVKNGWIYPLDEQRPDYQAKA